MPLTWNEIRLRASQFCDEWKDKSRTAIEKSDAYDFMTDFFNVFGVSRKRVAILESRINIGVEKDLFGENISSKKGYMDLFYKGNIIIEMKSPGKDKAKAYLQAKEYAENLNDKDLPSCILISDFLSFDYYYLDENKNPEIFLLEDLVNKVELFGFLAGYKDVEYKAVNPVDIEAAEHMGELHDALKENNYTGHELEMYLVRLLFCLFADDSGIFDEKKVFFKYILDTKEDGSNLAQELGLLFEMLNKPKDERQKNISEIFKKFPYINGSLFEERLSTAAFNSNMRITLLNCCKLDWSKIKPEIFGAMFQSIKDKESRRELGEHYTSEINILKVIKPLFLDDLWNEFYMIKKLSKALRMQRLLDFHTKLQTLKFLDPACGCGNFLVVSYRELRLLEIKVLTEYLQDQKILDIELMIRVNVDQFYGIEIVEFPAQIAKAALWLMDHLMNTIASEKFGKYIVRIPLTATPNIVIGNAITIDWENIVSKNELNYILGNPPFVGYKLQTEKQKSDLQVIFKDNVTAKTLDYVTAWYIKSSQYIQNTKINVAFVSTNSICQGEQALILWNSLFNKYNIKINFAHQTFKWSNEAKGKAAVYVVIIGFSLFDAQKLLFVYDDVKSEPHSYSPKMINHYLIEAETIFIKKKSTPIQEKTPELSYGSEPREGGFLLLSSEEKDEILKKEPKLKKYIKRFMSSDDFINNIYRYCFWLVNADTADIKNSKILTARLEQVRKFREKSLQKQANASSETPSLFTSIRQPKSDYLLIPIVSSDNRKYIPIGYIDKNVITSNANFTLPDASLYHFGILTSKMHMVWTSYVCGRLKNDYRYSNTIVYNNFAFPNPTVKQKEAIEKAVQEVLNIRDKFPNSSLAALYDPLTMPLELLKAHQKLDKAVEKAYGKEFTNDTDRISHLFYLYRKETEGLLVEKPKRRKK
ncbi:MAG: hypothetical protein LBG94_06205 [Treponema sp.]|jgi:type II restriction/modification system DNA methylase subunit YeeA|nr:hypothetical protein [Treponema sp.]